MNNYEMYMKDKLYKLRKDKNMTQDQLANELGISYQAVSKWENGTACPDIMTLPKIAEIYGIRIDELFREVAPGETTIDASVNSHPTHSEDSEQNLPWDNDDIYRGNKFEL